MTANQPWRCELEQWLKPFLVRLVHPKQRAMFLLYIAGLVGSGDRKTVQSMVHQLDQASYDGLHHFVSSSSWDAAPLQDELLTQAAGAVGSDGAVLVVEDIAVPKKGIHSVGVAAQYASNLGRVINCQKIVALTLFGGGQAMPIVLRLCLPGEWTTDRTRLAKAGVPADYRLGRAKAEMALAEIDAVIASGLRFDRVVADAAYGDSAIFRRGLSERGLQWAAGVSADRGARPGTEAPGERAAGGQPAAVLQTVEAMLDGRRLRVPVWHWDADGPRHRIFAACRALLIGEAPDAASGGRPGDDVWLIGEQRSSGELRYYASDSMRAASHQDPSASVEARWACEQALQQLQTLGLGHYEGRSWTGLHRHMLMTLIAFAFLHQRRPRRQGREAAEHRVAPT